MENFGEVSFEDTLNKIREISASAAQTESQELAQTETIAEAGIPTESESVPDLSQATGEQAPVTDNSAPQAEVMSPRLRRLLDKEAQLIERENAIAAREATVTPTQPASNYTFEQFKRKYLIDPVAALKDLDNNFNANRLATRLYRHDLGDLAPPEAQAQYQAESAVSIAEQVRAELEQTKQEMLAELQRERAENALHQYRGALHSYATAVPESLPLVKKFVAKKPDKVVAALEGVARRHAQANQGEVLTPEQAAQKLEAALREYQLADPAPVNTAAPTESPKPEVKAPSTLRNKHTVTQAPKVAEDDLDDNKLRQRALAAIEARKRAVLTNG